MNKATEVIQGKNKQDDLENVKQMMEEISRKLMDEMFPILLDMPEPILIPVSTFQIKVGNSYD